MTLAATVEPNVHAMPEGEKVLIASALAAIGADWPDRVSQALHAPEKYFTDPTLQLVAVTLCILHDRPVPPEYSAADFTRAYPQHRTLAAQLADYETNLVMAEVYAATLVTVALGRKTAQQFVEIGTEMLDKPEKAHLIANIGVKALQDLADAASPRSGLSCRTPDDILALPDDPQDNLLGDRLLTRGGKLVIAGAGGTGKSRLGLQLVASIVTGQPFLAFPTNGHNLKWLVLQGENDNIRLKHDLSGLKRHLTPEQWQAFQARVVIHTIETELDSWLTLEDDASVASIRRLLAQEKPDGVILDALYTFGIGDLNKDTDMRATLTQLQRIIHHGNPKRAIVVVHHAQTGKAGLSKMTGHDRASFGRNSKVLHSWARGQINVGALDPANNDLLGFSCGKASNGREFQPFAARLTENMVYELDASVDVNETVATASGNAHETVVIDDEVADLCPGEGISKGNLAKRLKSETGCSQATAYRAVSHAIKSGKIKVNSITKLLQDRSI